MKPGKELTPKLKKAEVLDEWLNKLQETLPGKVIVIYDACIPPRSCSARGQGTHPHRLSEPGLAGWTDWQDNWLAKFKNHVHPLIP